MEISIYCVFLFVTFSTLCFSTIQGENKNVADTWNIQDQCGRELHSYGGVLNFDAMRLRQQHCTVTIVGKGVNNTMISLYFTTFNVSDGCHANITIKEPNAKPNPISPFNSRGLYQKFCRSNHYLNENVMYTTDHNILTISFDGGRSPSDLMFTLKFAAFIGVRGCDLEAPGMFSCPSGRCVHTDVLCKDLNPCGDGRDCNVTSVPRSYNEEKKGLHYINFVIIFAVVLFAVFALIQITLIIRNEQPVCYRHDKKIRLNGDTTKVRIEAELMPMKSNGRVDEYVIEDGVRS
ncbi:hypothetical protein ACF0H5_005890 [Mactra antiquata]